MGLKPAACCSVILGILASASPALGVSSHAPITIASDSDFTTCGCVVSGSGTSSDPYVIGPWSVSNSTGDGVHINGSKLTKSFVLYELTVNGNAGNGITLTNINPTIVAKVYGGQTTANNDAWGVQVTNSSGVVLDGVGVNTRGPGVAASGFATANTNRVGGIDLENSTNITVRGWQMNANGSDSAPDWITLDPGSWGGGGLRMFAVSGSTIDHNAANNSSDGHFMLFDSSNNVVSNNTAGYPYTMNFLLTDGSSYNTVTGNDAWDGDYVGVLVADPLPGSWTLAQYGPAHDNTITANNIHSNGPTGNELNAGLVPAFLGGIVLLNGTYSNSVTDNSTYASTATDLGWAQAVPDPTTPIGVKNYPPLLHCNVTVYDGPLSKKHLQPPPLNGNIWSGNSYKVIDPCLPPQ
jgi:parallel beta-helix repeat protein